MFVTNISMLSINTLVLNNHTLPNNTNLQFQITNYIFYEIISVLEWSG